MSATAIIPTPPPVTVNGNQQSSQYKLRGMSARLAQDVKRYTSILAAKRIERRDLKYSHGTTTKGGLDKVLEQIVLHGSDAFKRDVSEMKTHLDTEIPFGNFKLFRTAYASRRRSCELEFIVMYARKREVSSVVVVDYMMATYLHQRQQNDAAKISGGIVAGIGTVALITGCFLAGPVGWAAIGLGGASAAAGLGTAISGTNDTITGKHAEDIEAGVLGHMLESGLVKQVGTDVYIEFE